MGVCAVGVEGGSAPALASTLGSNSGIVGRARGRARPTARCSTIAQERVLKAHSRMHKRGQSTWNGRQGSAGQPASAKHRHELGRGRTEKRCLHLMTCRCHPLGAACGVLLGERAEHRQHEEMYEPRADGAWPQRHQQPLPEPRVARVQVQVVCCCTYAGRHGLCRRLSCGLVQARKGSYLRARFPKLPWLTEL